MIVTKYRFYSLWMSWQAYLLHIANVKELDNDILSKKENQEIFVLSFYNVTNYSIDVTTCIRVIMKINALHV